MTMRDTSRFPPPLWLQAWSLAGSLAAFLADGCRTVPQAEYEERLALCDACDRRRGVRCTACNCILPLKARGRAMLCPLDKWRVLTEMDPQEPLAAGEPETVSSVTHATQEPVEQAAS
jgi:hypothetical protein